MSSLNKAMIMGRLGSDPELKTTNSGNQVANLSIATESFWKDGAGTKKSQTEWHRVIVWGQQAQFCGQYLKKGSFVYVEGRIETRSWEDKDGGKRYTTEIVAQNVIAPKGNSESKPNEGQGSFDENERMPF